jgi:hypothetical protein
MTVRDHREEYLSSLTMPQIRALASQNNVEVWRTGSRTILTDLILRVLDAAESDCENVE